MSFNSRGTKRSRQTVVDEIDVGAKRLRREAEDDDDDGGEGSGSGIVSQIRKIGSSCLNWIVDRFGGNRQRGPNMSQGGEVDELEEEQTAPIDMTRRRQQPEEEEAEVEFLKEVKPEVAAAASPLRFGSMSYGPLGRRHHQRHFRVATKEKRAKEKLARSPESILARVRSSDISAARKPAADCSSFWLDRVSSANPSYLLRQKFPLQKTIGRTPTRTPRAAESRAAFNREDHLKYSAILFGAEGGNNRRWRRPRSLFHKAAAKKSSDDVTTKVDDVTVVAEHEVVTLEDDDEEEVVVVVPASEEEEEEEAGANAPSEPEVDVVEIINIYSPRRPRVDDEKKKNPRRRSEYLEGLQLEKVVQEDFLEQLRRKYDHRERANRRLVREQEVRVRHGEDRLMLMEKNLEERLREHLRITEVAIPEPPEEEEEVGLPEITQQMEDEIEDALRCPGTVVDAHKIPIARSDLDTLRGLNWLNDEVINFYMQMIVERSSRGKGEWPKVYATNTFFYPKLMQSGHSALKRWTRKVDLFDHDLIIVPVHLGMHWCLATVDLKHKGVFYYDSMGGDNRACLKALLKYIEDEHADKKKAPYDTSGFTAEIVKDIPQQMNGSDCGMFTCKFAEYLSRNADVTFSQEDMPYFRRRMVWEIAKNTLLHP